MIPKLENKGTRWRLSMEHFYITGPQSAEDGETPSDALPPLEAPTDEAPVHADPGMGYIFEHTRGKKCLIFVNSREECEAVTTTLRQYCEIKNEPDRFLIHHGNLSAAYRETAEAVMKDDEQFRTTVTTATLEPGHRYRAAGARVPDRRAVYSLLLPAADGPDRAARPAAGDVVRNA